MRTNQKRAIAALLTAESIEEAAGVAGVGERTLYWWLIEDVEFQAALREEQNQALDSAVSLISSNLASTWRIRPIRPAYK